MACLHLAERKPEGWPEPTVDRTFMGHACGPLLLATSQIPASPHSTTNKGQISAHTSLEFTFAASTRKAECG